MCLQVEHMRGPGGGGGGICLLGGEVALTHDVDFSGGVTRGRWFGDINGSEELLHDPQQRVVIRRAKHLQQRMKGINIKARIKGI
jgi:hypothetical protein